MCFSGWEAVGIGEWPWAFIAFLSFFLFLWLFLYSVSLHSLIFGYDLWIRDGVIFFLNIAKFSMTTNLFLLASNGMS